MEEKKLAKISSVRVGFCGYQDAMIGFEMAFVGKGWGIGGWVRAAWFDGPSEHAKWTVEDRAKTLAEAVMEIGQILRDAEVNDVSELVGIPVEVTIENNTFKSFRVLTEVL
jgi:hypothetical protein